jgi:hypothetical protein
MIADMQQVGGFDIQRFGDRRVDLGCGLARPTDSALSVHLEVATELPMRCTQALPFEKARQAQSAGEARRARS